MPATGPTGENGPGEASTAFLTYVHDCRLQIASSRLRYVCSRTGIEFDNDHTDTPATTSTDGSTGCTTYSPDSKEQAVREAMPYYEEHAKMFAPLGFFCGLTDEQTAAVARRGGWADADFPTIDRQVQSRSWFCGIGDEMIANLQELQKQFPGLETVNV